jgi:hypothetical protein
MHFISVDKTQCRLLRSRRDLGKRSIAFLWSEFRVEAQRPIGKPAILRSVRFPGRGPLLEAEAEQAPGS